MEVAVAYSALWDDTFSRDGADGFYELGWTLSLCANLSRSLGVVGEASGHYTSDDTFDAFGVPLSVDRDLLGVHAACATRTGAKLRALRPGPRRDAQRARAPLARSDVRSSPWASICAPRGAWAPAWRRLPPVLGEEENRNEVRLHAGLVIAIGDR
jgi:hypothetical protein